MHILLLASLTPATGNLVSAERIRSHFENAGHLVTMHDVHADILLKDVIQKQQIDALFGIHAYRAGRLLHDCQVPYGLLLPGPDIALFDTSKEQAEIMTVAIAGARIVTTYHPSIQQHAQAIWPTFAHKIIAIHKAVTVEPSSYSLRQELFISPSQSLFLHICGIRPVKDPLFLRETLQEWHAHNPTIHTVIIGQILDQEYAKRILPITQQTPGLHYHPPLARSDLHAAMREADAVLNTALVEGMPNALLEAMALGTPVIARSIPGNTCFIVDNRTGMLFATPEEFKEKASRILADQQLRRTITKNATSYIQTHHTLMQERRGYQTQVLPHLGNL